MSFSPGEGLREAESVIYAEVVRCAEQNIEMTKADDLSELSGKAIATTVWILNRLQCKGLIRIKRYQRSREIYVVAIDKSTKAPANQVPHWRDVERSKNIPTVSIHTLAQKRPDEAMEINQEIRRLGKLPADFIADLVHMGWHEYLAGKAEHEMAEAA